MAREMVSHLHRDLKLGLVLVSAAVLVKIVAWSSLAAERFIQHGVPYGWLPLAGTLGGLAVIGAAIWVDRRPPHAMMAAGIFVAAAGLAVVLLASSVAVAVVGMFVAGVGSAAVGSLVFYAIAAKGATRYKGALIGTLGMVFSAPIDLTDAFQLFHLDEPVLWTGLALALAGAAVLFLLLPRVFAAPQAPGPTFRETLAVPKVRLTVAWMIATFFVASMITATAQFVVHSFSNISTVMFAIVGDVSFQLQVFRISTGLGVLIWGIASDFYPGRRLFLAAGLLLLPASGVLWASYALEVLAVGLITYGFVTGSLVCLPWVLTAELLSTRHFAKMGLGVMFFGIMVGGMFGQILLGGLADDWVTNAHFWSIPFLGIALALVAWRLPRPLEPARVSPPQNGVHRTND